MQRHNIPFPCAVYSRDRAGNAYSFSHFCQSSIPKEFPRSLRVSDLRQYAPAQNLAAMRRAFFLVMVAGDRAFGLSVANHTEQRTHFLYTGSRYSSPAAWPSRPEELEDGFVPLVFCSTLASFRRGVFASAMPMESSLILLPTLIRERDLPRLARWVEQKLWHAIRGSVWATETGSFNEASLRPRSRLAEAPARPKHDAGQPGEHNRGQAGDGVRALGVDQAVVAQGVPVAAL